MCMIYGIFIKKRNAINSKRREFLSFFENEASTHVTGSNVMLGFQRSNSLSGNCQEENSCFTSEGRFSITADARIDYKEELLIKLGQSQSSIINTTDSRLLILAYKKWGKECVKYLYGDFAFAIWDEEKGELFCARDHFGCRPFYFFNTPDFFVFSSNLRILLKLPSVPVLIDDIKIYKNALSVSNENEETHYKNISRLPPAHSILLSNSNMVYERYWELVKSARRVGVTEVEAKENLLKHLKNSIVERIRSQDSICTELSGGLDSSSIAAIASELSHERNISISAFSHAMSLNQKERYSPFRDESYFSNKVIEHIKIKEHVKVTGENSGSLAPILNSFEYLSSPSPQNYGVFSDELLSAVKKSGGRVLLSGAGGDEMVSSKVPGYFAELVKSKEWEVLRREINIKTKKRKYPAFISWLVSHTIWLFPRSLELIEKFSMKRFFVFICRYNSIALSGHLKQKVRAKKIYRIESFKQIDGDVRERQRLELRGKDLVSRLENSYLAGMEYGVDYRYPLLDRKLIEYYFNLPTILKYKNGSGRYIFRRAIQGYLPQEICWRNDKFGVTIPNLPYRLFKDIGAFRELIMECRDNLGYHYFDYEKLMKISYQLENRDKDKKLCFGPGTFLYAIKILNLQKLQREGKIDIGIKC